jgi:two-component system sensor histidine kinase DegS
MQSPAWELGDLLTEAQRFSRASLLEINKLVDRAEAMNREAAGVLSELEDFLEQFALESGMTGGTLKFATFAGGAIDLEAMRADVARIAINASQTAILTGSLISLRDSIDNADRHFSSDAALKVSLDATSDHFQAAINEAREDERRRLAREIHDGPAQVLANAIYLVQIVEQLVKRNPDGVEEELGRLRDFLKEGVTEVRRFMFDLRPTTLQDYGLALSIERYVENFGRFSGRRATCSIEGTIPTLPPDHDLVVFRVVQEALQNAHKHAGSDASVEIKVCVEMDNLIVRISDDGVGFDPALVSPKLSSGAGLLGMRDRAAVARARLSIESRLGSGTVIMLTLPVDTQSELGQEPS